MKVYKGRQKLSLEQAASYYKHAYKIGMEHGRYSEQERVINIIQSNKNINSDQAFFLVQAIKGEQK